MLLLTQTQDRFLAINQIELHLFETYLKRNYIKFEIPGNLYNKSEIHFNNSFLMLNISGNTTLSFHNQSQFFIKCTINI